MEIAAESGLGTTLLGNLMVANRPLATPVVRQNPGHIDGVDIARQGA
jgi:hypothetical protein